MYDIPSMWNLKRNDYRWTDLQNRKRLTDLGNEIMVAGGRDGAKGEREFGMDMYTLLYLKWITTNDLLYST